jgi:hypothetical protein
MQSDVRSQIFRVRALERWENEGGSVVNGGSRSNDSALAVSSGFGHDRTEYGIPVWNETNRTPKEAKLEN